MIGRQVSHFYIVGRLGSGGMGDVYEAQDLRLPRSVAVKLLKPSLTQSATAVKRFKREAWLSASLNHPNICTILDVGESEGLSFIAMELLQGMSLKQRLREGPLPPAEWLSIAIDVARALVEAHGAGIIHRDITPGNIFLTQQGAAKVVDFGLAKALPSDEEAEHVTDEVTEPGVLPGTVHHLSPEQLQHGRVDRRSDLFALGTVLYLAATGMRPFDSQMKSDVIAQILGHDPVPLRRLAPHYPVVIEQIVSRLLEKQPDRRYQRAADLLKDLERARALQQPADVTDAAVRLDAAPVSIAVLPFVVAGDEDPDLRGFRDGLAEDVAWSLQNIPGVHVASRTSTESLRGQSIRAIGERLGVDAVIEGSVQRAGTRLRVISRLLNARTDEPLRPALRTDVDAGDLLTVQDEVAREIAAGVKSAVARGIVGVATRRTDAYFEYERGLHAMRDVFEGGWNKAIEHGTRASEIDPQFAPAYVMLADAYNALGMLSFMRPKLAFERSHAAAERALSLDAGLATAYGARGFVRFGGDWDWDGAEADFRRALDIDADLAAVRVHYSWLLGLLGREAAALGEADRAVTKSKSRFVRTGAALTYFMAARYDETIARCHDCLATDPDYIFATYLRGQCHHLKGEYALAHADLERAAALGRRAPFYLGLLGKSYGEAGLRDRALAIIDELNEIRQRQYVAPHCYVYVFHGLGERDRALAHQEEAYRDGAGPLNYLTPYIRNLFSLDPHHRDRLRQMRLNV